MFMCISFIIYAFVGFNYHFEHSSNIRVFKSRAMELARRVLCMVKSRGACGGLDGKPEGKRPLGMPGRRWKDNMKIILK